MKTVILCGGQGTRIRDVSIDLPKPMIEIGPYPILWHIMSYYASYGYKDFVLCLGYLGNVIRDFFMHYDSRTRDAFIRFGKETQVEFVSSFKAIDWSVLLAETGLNAMTGARVKKIQRYIGDDEYFMLTYGDGVGDINIEKLVAFHKSHGKILTVTGVYPPGRFGEMRCDASGLVTNFNEKPQVTSGMISGGYFVCSNRLFDYLDNGDDLIFEDVPIKRLVADNQMMVYQHDGFWQPMDTHREYLLLNQLYQSGQAPWVNWHD